MPVNATSGTLTLYTIEVSLEDGSEQKAAGRFEESFSNESTDPLTLTGQFYYSEE